MTLYFLIKYLHVLGAIVILGTGSGIAFFMLMAGGGRPVDDESATSFTERWLLVSLALYATAGLFWVPVIFMQREMRDLARLAAEKNQPLRAPRS
jgi:uncharacterized membrane protein